MDNVHVYLYVQSLQPNNDGSWEVDSMPGVTIWLHSDKGGGQVYGRVLWAKV